MKLSTSKRSLLINLLFFLFINFNCLFIQIITNVYLVVVVNSQCITPSPPLFPVRSEITYKFFEPKKKNKNDNKKKIVIPGTLTFTTSTTTTTKKPVSSFSSTDDHDYYGYQGVYDHIPPPVMNVYIKGSYKKSKLKPEVSLKDKNYYYHKINNNKNRNIRRKESLLHLTSAKIIPSPSSPPRTIKLVANFGEKFHKTYGNCLFVV